MNKTFTTALLLLSTHILYAQNYFQPGMVWEELIFPDEPFYDDIPVKHFLGDYVMVEGREACPMYVEYPNNPEKGTSLECYVSAIGNKVYTLCGKDEKSWELMYDFDIAAGQIIEVWKTPEYHNNCYGSGPYKIRCLETNIETTPAGDIEMILVDDLNENYPDFSLTAKWIKGIGSEGSSIWNCRYEVYGLGYRLLKASLNGQTLYEWSLESKITLRDEESGSSEYYNLQGVRIDTPQHGDLLIEVSKSGCKKRIF